MCRIFEAMVQSAAGDHLVGAMAEARREGVALRAEFGAMAQEIFADLEADEWRRRKSSPFREGWMRFG